MLKKLTRSKDIFYLETDFIWSRIFTINNGEIDVQNIFKFLKKSIIVQHRCLCTVCKVALYIQYVDELKSFHILKQLPISKLKFPAIREQRIT